MKKDYYSVLVRALPGIDPADSESRHAIYDRARYAMARAPLTIDEIGQERLALEAAIRRIEAEIAATGDMSMSFAISSEQASDGAMAAVPLPEVAASSRLGPRPPYLLLTGLASLAILIAGLVGHHYWRKSGRGDFQTAAQVIDRSSVQPRADAAPDESRSYISRRQLVYYRSIHPAGTIVITKSQNLLYLIRPNTAAMRYTIGVGQDCSSVVGLLLISAKEDWSGISMTMVRNDIEPAVRTNGRQFGARSLALSDTGHRIHGSKDPLARRVVGCFPLINEDVIDLYERVALGTRVIMN